MNLLSKNGRVYYSHHAKLITESTNTIVNDLLPLSLYYQLPLYRDKDNNELYILEQDIITYLSEYFYIQSLYGLIMY